MEYTVVSVIVVIVVVIALAVKIAVQRNRTGRRSATWVDTSSFQRQKAQLYDHCDEQTVAEFLDFLKQYKGGYVKRRNGRIVYQEFLGKEKGDLKGIFYHVIVPDRKISIKQKEQVRIYLRSIGVSGLEQRPPYEQRSGRLKAGNGNEEEYHRKLSGNRGEQKVRDGLSILKESGYSVLNGVVLKFGDTVKEFDHIVVGATGVFVLETKAFGMSDQNTASDKARLVIDMDGQWKLYKNHRERILKVPTEQILEERQFMERLLADTFAEVTMILVLANDELTVEKRISLDYELLMRKDLIHYITQQDRRLRDNDACLVISKLNECRLN